MKNQAVPYNSRSGNVLFIIFIAIALFAALSYVIAQTGRTGESMVGTEQTKLTAMEIIQYSGNLRQAIKTLKINGCLDTQISFENPDAVGLYENTNAPNSHACHLFHVDGANMKYITFENDHIKSQVFLAKSALPGVGTTCANDNCSDLYLHISYEANDTTRNLCKEFNKLLGHTDIPEPLSLDFAYGGTPGFTGTYGSALNDAGTPYEGKQAGCFQWSGTPTSYIYYYTLLAR